MFSGMRVLMMRPVVPPARTAATLMSVPVGIIMGLCCSGKEERIQEGNPRAAVIGAEDGGALPLRCAC
jgi:hypothetical protein